MNPNSFSKKVVIGIVALAVATTAGLILFKTSRENTPRVVPQSQTPTKLPTIPQAKITPLVGWKKIVGNGVELFLPESYEGGNPNQDLEAIAQKLKAINSNYEAQIKPIQKNRSIISLVAFDKQTGKSGFLTNVNIMPQKFPPGTTIEQFLKVAVKEISSQHQVRETKIVPWNQYQAARLIAESTTTKDKIKQLFYAIPQGDIFWLITYSTSAEEFDQRLPSFETSIRNFVIKS